MTSRESEEPQTGVYSWVAGGAGSLAGPRCRVFVCLAQDLGRMSRKEGVNSTGVNVQH